MVICDGIGNYHLQRLRACNSKASLVKNLREKINEPGFYVLATFIFLKVLFIGIKLLE